MPTDATGLINAHDSVALMGFKNFRDKSFAIPVAVKKYSLQNEKSIVKWDGLKDSNCIVLKEPIEKGQSISSFVIQIKNKMELVKEISGTTIGGKRIISFHYVKADAVEIIIQGVRFKLSFSEASVHLIDDDLVGK